MQDDETDESNAGGEGDDSGATLAEKTDAASERMEKANAEKKALIEREEELYAKQKLGGKSSGGDENPPPPKKDTDDEYANKFMKGEVNPLKEDGIEL